MRERKCRTLNCKSFFPAETRRQFCDVCLHKHKLAGNARLRLKYKSNPVIRKAKLEYTKKYNKANREKLRDYKRVWMRDYRMEKKKEPPKPVAPKRTWGPCKNCAYRLMGESVCPRCGK